MDSSPSPESELLLPPWSRRRRRLVLILMIGFILLASGLIGIGIYQVGIEMGIITPPLNKETLTQVMLSDASFLRAVKLAGRRHECANHDAHFKLMYQAPFRPLHTTGAEACRTFVALHPTGADVLATIVAEGKPRNQLASTYSALFSSVNVDFLSGSGYETTRLIGLKENIATTIYLIKVEARKTWIITYAPTSPTLDALVQDMVEQFRVLP